MKPLNVPGTSTLQSVLKSHNDAVRDYQSFWKNIMVTADSDKVFEARAAVTRELKSFLSSNPAPLVADQVKSWVVNNARDPVSLLERLQSIY